MTPPIRIAVRVLRCCGALGSSARPIFTVFDSMKQVQDAVREAAMRRFAEPKLPDMPLFKQVGMQMVLFGAREPKLYQLTEKPGHKRVRAQRVLCRKFSGLPAGASYTPLAP